MWGHCDFHDVGGAWCGFCFPVAVLLKLGGAAVAWMNKRRFFPSDWSERLLLGIALLLQLAMLGVIAGALMQQQWLVAFTGSVVFVLTFTPAIIERQLDVRLPVEFTFVTCVFLYASFGLGEVQNFYYKFWWWDLLLHSCSALVMGLIGFLSVYVFYMTHRIRLAPVYVAMVSFGFAVTLGSLWEVFEFLMDWLLGLNMQKSGLTDTMTDLMVNIVGSLIAAAIGYMYVRNGDSMIADKMIRSFVAKNPRLFDRGRTHP